MGTLPPSGSAGSAGAGGVAGLVPGQRPGRSGVLDALWENYPDNLFLVRVERDGRFVVEAVNPALRERFQLPADSLEGRSIEDIHGAETARDILANYRECLRLRRTIYYEEPSRSPIADDEVFETILMPISGNPSSSNDGEITHLLGISRAITRLRRAEQALRQANFELEFRLERKLEELEVARDTIRRLAVRDELTGCYNRSIFMEIAERELARCRRETCHRALLILDMDGLAAINNRFGNAAGDGMLTTVIAMLRESIGSLELLGRCKGGQFILLLEREAGEAERFGTEFCGRVAELMPDWRGEPVSLSVSIGASAWAGPGTITLEQMSLDAVTALDEAKAAGGGVCRIRELG